MGQTANTTHTASTFNVDLEYTGLDGHQDDEPDGGVRVPVRPKPDSGAPVLALVVPVD